MKLNIENCANNGDEGIKAWALDELVRHLKEMRDMSNSGDMAAAVTEFFQVFRFNDNQMDPAPIRAAVAAQPEAGEAVVEAFKIALRQTWGMVDPLRPPEAGSYYLGEHNGIIAALKTIRENFEHAMLAVCPPPPAKPEAGGPTDADWADFGAWAERDKGAMDMLGKLVDVWDDGQLPHEHRCYVEGAWAELIAEARALLASAPTIQPTQPVQEREALRFAEQSMAAMREALMPAFEYVGVSLRVSQEDHTAIRSALAGLSTSLHMVRAALSATPAQAGDAGEPSDDMDAHRANGLAWAVSRWNDEVANRPTVNIHRRTLDGTWRQCIRYFGGDPVKLIGPAHDDLVIARQTPVTSRAQTATRRCGHPLGATRWCPDCETNSATKDQP